MVANNNHTPEFTITPVLEDGRLMFALHDDMPGLVDIFATREQAEREAQQLAYRITKGKEIEVMARGRAAQLIAALADQICSELVEPMAVDFGLDRELVLLSVQWGIEDGLDDLCPQG